MITAQTRRRRRGRAIRKARRTARSRTSTVLSPLQLLSLIGRRIESTIDALARRFWDFWLTVRVAAARMLPLIFTPHDGAGARRQLLHNGRAPKGRR